MKIDPYYQRQKCRPMILVSGNIRFMRIFAGVRLDQGIKRHITQALRFCGVQCIARSVIHAAAYIGRHAQLTRCFSAVAELLVLSATEPAPQCTVSALQKVKDAFMKDWSKI